MLVTDNKIQEIITFLRRRYPRWSNFSDERFIQDELALKRDTIWKMGELLGEAIFRQLLADKRHEEILVRLDYIGRANQQASRNMPTNRDLAILQQTRVEASTLCNEIYQLIYGAPRTAERLQQWADFVTHVKLPNGWVFPLFLVSAAHPRREMFFRPRVMRWFLQFMGWPLTCPSEVSGDFYRALGMLLQELQFTMNDVAQGEMLDFQCLIWVCFCIANDEPINWIEEPRRPNRFGTRFWSVSVAESRLPGDMWNQAEFLSSNEKKVEDATKLNRLEFDHLREELLSNGERRHPSDIDFVWALANEIKEGDRVLVHRGREIAGTGRVIGSYVYDAASLQPHRVPIKWERQGSATVEEPGLPAGLVEVDAHLFENMERRLPLTSTTASASFAESAFSLLEQLRADKTGQVMGKNRAELEQAVEQPFHRLLKDATAHLSDRVRNLFYTIPRTLYGHATETDYYLGYFYRKGGQRRGEPRLFLMLREDGLEMGFSIEWYGGQHQDRFVKNFESTLPRTLEILEGLMQDGLPLRIFPIASPDKWHANQFIDATDHEIRLAAFVSKESVLNMSGKTLAELASQVYERLFPLLLLAIADEPFDPETPERMARLTIPETAIPPAVPADPQETVTVPSTTSEEPETDKATLIPEKEEVPLEAGSDVLSFMSLDVPVLEQPVTLDVAPLPAAVEIPVPVAMAEESVIAAATETKDSLADVAPAPLSALDRFVNDTGVPLAVVERWAKALERKGQAVFSGAPGMGKTFLAERLAQALVEGNDGFVQILQMHPGYSYEEFVQGGRTTSPAGAVVSAPGRFVQFCRNAEKRTGPCVLVLDEIHRVDLPRVFGELMYLLEYRNRDMVLASGEKLRIPANVRLLATTSSKASAMDSVMRRRFAFLELEFRPEVLRHFHRQTTPTVEPLIAILTELNAAIGDPRRQLGMAPFLRPDVWTELQDIWVMEVEPYLETVFASDAGLLGTFRWSAVASRLSL